MINKVFNGSFHSKNQYETGVSFCEATDTHSVLPAWRLNGRRGEKWFM